MIELKNVNKWYNKNKQNEIHVIDNISLELPEKGMVAIFGKSGCGKTTLLNAIGGLDKAQSGDIRIFGKSINTDTDYLRNRHIGYIFQNYYLSKDKTVYENVADALRLCGMTDEDEIEKRVIAALESVNMKKFVKRTPDALSGGQQQRVAIARAIVKSPSIILADEPTGNIDEKNTIAIMDMLRAISKNSLVLLVTHEAKLVDYYCDKVIELQDGHITNIYENDQTGGYVGRDKNTIYLGELECSKDSFEGIDIEYYGEKTPGLRLQIIKNNGKLYIKSSDPAMKMIDGTGEIKLHEGVYDKETEHSRRETSIKTLPSFEGKNFGKLYSFKSSVAESFKELHPGKKRGIKSGLLKLCMFTLAVVLVISSANFSVFIRDYLDAMSNFDENVLYMPVLSTMKDVDFNDKLEEYGIDYMGIVENIYEDNSWVYFTALDFMTARSVTLQANGNWVPEELIKDCRTVAGKNKLESADEMIITTAAADQLLSSSPVNIIHSYDDLIGLSTRINYNLDSSKKIVGIVENDEKYFVLDRLSLAYNTYRNFDMYRNLMPKSLYNGPKASSLPEIPAQSAVVINSVSMSALPTLEPVKIAGMTFDITDSFTVYTSEKEYSIYAENELKLLSFSDFASSDEISANYNSYQAKCLWLYDYYYAGISDYLKAMQNYRALTFELWLLTEHYSPDYLFLAMYYDEDIAEIDWSEAQICYAGYIYKRDKGEYPADPDTAMQYLNSLNTDEYYSGLNTAEIISENAWRTYGAAYDAYQSNYYNSYHNFDNYEEMFVISDEDYLKLFCRLGETSNNIYHSDFIYSYDDDYPHTYFFIHASDTKKAASFLSNYVDSDRIVTPDNYKSFILSDKLPEIIANLTSFVVMLALLCVCVFFIMRSITMNRVKEIGIYRAIGVSKKNLIFKFFIYVSVLTTLTVFIGYALTSAIVISMQSNPLVGESIYFPFWLAAALYIFIYAVCALFGTLPVISLLKKTPSAILAKYDI